MWSWAMHTGELDQNVSSQTLFVEAVRTQVFLVFVSARIRFNQAKSVNWTQHSFDCIRFRGIAGVKGNCSLTHWGRVTHICVGKLISIGSDNGLSPGRRQAITWTNAGKLLIGPLRTNFREISIEIRTFSFKKMRLKVSSAKWRPFCLGLNVLRSWLLRMLYMYCSIYHECWPSLLTHIIVDRTQWVNHSMSIAVI